MTDWSKKWDTKESKMDESDIKAGSDEPEKERVNVETEEEVPHQPPTFSGLYCSVCRDIATFIFEGDSLCWKHYDDKMSEIMKDYKGRNNK